MNKIFTLIAVGAISVFATNTAKAQAVEEGTMLVDLNYGFPNLYSATLEAAYNQAGTAQNVEFNSFGPGAVKFEYLVTDKIGVGLEVNYANSSMKYSERDEDSGNTYDYEISVPRLRIMPKFNFHFGRSDSFDGYFSVGAGYKSSHIEVTSTEPDYDENSNTSLSLGKTAFRLAVGGRYFFSDLIGANLEIGLGGGALLNAGIAIRFNK